jgi:hypothetical protein
LFKHSLYWSDPEWDVKEAVFIRKHHTSEEWTTEEDALR